MREIDKDEIGNKRSDECTTVYTRGRIVMRYLMILVFMMVLAGTAFGQENAAGEEEVTYATIDPEDRIEPNGRDMGNIRGRINEIKEVVQTDYEVLLATDPEATGTVTINFSITPEGSVLDASVDCPEELSSLQEDILSVLAELDFGVAPDQAEDIPIEVPFTLTPSQ